MTARLTCAALVALTLALSATGCGGDGADLGEFCAAVDALRDESPFAGLDIASPAEMAAAFDDLVAATETVAAAAPGDLAGRADRYHEAAEAVRDELRAADFDPRRVDTLRYGRATADYEAAAISVENAADDACAQD